MNIKDEIKIVCRLVDYLKMEIEEVSKVDLRVTSFMPQVERISKRLNKIKDELEGK